MDIGRQSLKIRFPLLDISGTVTDESFRNAGYFGCQWRSDNLKNLIHAINWCHENASESFHFMSNIVWFTNKEDATEFALMWL